MNDFALFLFVILLSSLILCAVLGTRYSFENFTTNSTDVANGQVNTVTTNQGNTYGAAVDASGNLINTYGVNGSVSSNISDSYNHYTGNSYPSILYGPAGETAQVVQKDGTDVIIIKYPNGNTEVYYAGQNSSGNANKYMGPNGSYATIITTTDGKKAIKLYTQNGATVIFTDTNAYIYKSTDQPIDNTSYDTNTSSSGTSYDDAFANTTPYTSSNTNGEYNSTLPTGVSKNEIPAGQEDLYILKSEVVPPVCPACPNPIIAANVSKKCNACPPCGRCPDPAFHCKKVPTYSSENVNVPQPILGDFTSFGM